MSKEDRGVLLFDKQEPKISGYLIIGNEHYQIFGERVSDIRTNLTIKKPTEKQPVQADIFDERSSSQSGNRQRDTS